MSVLLRSLLLLVLVMPTLTQARPLVVASIEPLAMVMRDLLGERAEVRTLLLPGQNPHQGAMTPGQARLVRDADLLVWLGDQLEPAVAGLASRRSGAQLMLQSLPGIYLREDDEGHHHGHGGHHHQHGRYDPHLWLYPDNMVLLARTLAEQPPQGIDGDWLAERADVFIAELESGVERLRTQLAPFADQHYLSHHDPWAYFADAFAVPRPMVISHNLDASASSRRFVELSRQVSERGVGCILAEPEGSRALLRRLCGEQCRLVEADPLGRGLAGQPYLALLDDLARRYQQCLGEAPQTDS